MKPRNEAWATGGAVDAAALRRPEAVLLPHRPDAQERQLVLVEPEHHVAAARAEPEAVGGAGGHEHPEGVRRRGTVADARRDRVPIREIRELDERPERQRRVGERSALGVVGLAAGRGPARSSGVVADGSAPLGLGNWFVVLGGGGQWSQQ